MKHLAFKLTQNQSERASILVLKWFFSIFGGRPLFEFSFSFSVPFLYVRACARACMHAHVHACFLVIRRIHALYMHAHIYIYIYIYIHTHTHKTHMDECMHHDDACTDLCFSLTHMHAHRLPHPDMLHSRGIKAG